MAIITILFSPLNRLIAIVILRNVLGEYNTYKSYYIEKSKTFALY
jgi:hypothetical protein